MLHMEVWLRKDKTGSTCPLHELAVYVIRFCSVQLLHTFFEPHTRASAIVPFSCSNPFYSVMVSVSVHIALSAVFHSINSPDNSPFSDCSSGLLSVLLILSTMYLFIKVSLSPDTIPIG